MAMLRPVARVIRTTSLCAVPSNLSRTTLLQSPIALSSSCSLLFSNPQLQFRTFTSSAPPNPDRLSWDEFLRLRRQRRFSGVVSSVPSSMLGVYGGLQYFGSGEIDPTQTILGFDPILMNAAFVLGCGVLGWIIGPTIGRGLWNAFHRRQARLISQVRPLSVYQGQSSNLQREVQFFKHIEKNRADPSFQSYSNPVPDYYGMCDN